eukprot:COSAG03_NODE_306_length_9154_cov_7.381999_3_plen_104_part_00
MPRLLVLLAGVAEHVTVGRRCRSARLGIDLFGWLHQAVVNHYDSLVVQNPPNYGPVVQEVLDRARNYLGRHRKLTLKPHPQERCVNAKVSSVPTVPTVPYRSK